MNNDIANYFKALSNPVRLRIYLHCASKSEGAAPAKKRQADTCIGETAKTLNIPQSTVSNHFKVLEAAGLIKVISKGTMHYPYITKKPTKEILKQAQYFFDQSNKNPY